MNRLCKMSQKSITNKLVVERHVDDENPTNRKNEARLGYERRCRIRFPDCNEFGCMMPVLF